MMMVLHKNLIAHFSYLKFYIQNVFLSLYIIRLLTSYHLC